MSFPIILVTYVFSFFSTNAAPVGKHDEQKLPIVIIMSFDGFRYDYLEKVKTRTFSWAAKNGASATIQSAFVSRTFPNHVSMATGRYEETHGVISNVFWDPIYNDTFTITSVDPKWYNISEPIWITNEKAGNKRLSAVLNWIGGEIPFHGRKAHYSPRYDLNISSKTLLDMTLQQLDGVPPVNFVAVHLEEPDIAGHEWGPNSKQVRDAILQLDRELGCFFNELKKRNLFDKVNIIMTSDHGMAEMSEKRFTYLDEYLPPETYTLVETGANAFIIPHKGEEENIYKNLTKAPHIKVFRKKEMPSLWHYKRNRRITPIFITSDLGHGIAKNPETRMRDKGAHGFDNFFKEMDAFFVGYGPAFKKGYTKSKRVSIVNIYSLVCHLLGITPATNDGNLKEMADLLRPKHGQ